LLPYLLLPALRREEVKFHVALITPLQHVKGYAAPETKAAVKRARLLIEQAKALGEPHEDPLLVLRELARQFLTLAEKQGATVPLMVAHRIMGQHWRLREILPAPWLTSIGRSHFTILPSILRWRRDLVKTTG
jgi:hypothetical protein